MAAGTFISLANYIVKTIIIFGALRVLLILSIFGSARFHFLMAVHASRPEARAFVTIQLMRTTFSNRSNCQSRTFHFKSY